MIVQILYNIIVQPLAYLLELVFSVANHILNSEGSAIVVVSLVVNLLCLPLYRMADKKQREEQAKQRQMEHRVRHIKSAFRGDERYMVLAAYYRQRGYHPIEALYGALPLLLQVPFFMAAHAFLSNLEMLCGASYLCLTDLGQPDGLLSTLGLAPNLLPIVMTIINCISVALYTKNSPLRDKLQAYVLAVLFLVILYNSPSGLVLYWTCNQVFSLVKNVCLLYVPNERMGNTLMAQFCFALFVFALITANHQDVAVIVSEVLALAVFCCALWARYFLQERVPAEQQIEQLAKAQKRAREDDVATLFRSLDIPPRILLLQYLVAGILLTVLFGLLIPSAAIASSPTEFMHHRGLVNPMSYIAHTCSVWFGVYLFWTGVVYLLSTVQTRKILVLVLWCLVGIALVSYFFGASYGTLTATLRYEDSPQFADNDLRVSLLLTFGIAMVCVVIWLKMNSVLVPVLAIVSISLFVIAVPNLATIHTSFRDAQSNQAQFADTVFEADGSLAKKLSLSQNGQNVVVLFLDRAISGYVPYVFQERPELLEQFEGFVYYPNTIAHGLSTVFTSPSIYGGYEYTPAAMDARPDELLVNKNNEALQMLPELFSEEGRIAYTVNPPYANFQWTVDNSIFDDMENVVPLNLSGVYNGITEEKYGLTSVLDMNRQFFCYSLFKASPGVSQLLYYDGGSYLAAAKAAIIPESFINEYSTLEVLPDITSVDDSNGVLIQIHNETTHEPTLLQLPDYVPSNAVNNEDIGDSQRLLSNEEPLHMSELEHREHYHVNMASYLQLGKWFDWMREQGVYDNTRIIIVSDHGKGLGQWPNLVKDENLDLEAVNAVLMVKDFDAHGFTTSGEFMTVADVPTLAVTGVIEDVSNPYTGTELTSNEKTAHDQLVTTSWHWHTEDHEGRTTFDTSDRPWYSVHDDIFNLNNWTRLP